MLSQQREYVLRTSEERGVRLVRLWFTDVLGSLKSFAISPAELENALEDGMTFDGSSIDGFSRIQESDVLAVPDPDTFAVLPYRPEVQGVARMFCDITMPDGSQSFADPRYVLKRTLSRAADQGLTFYTHPEIEFYLFKEPHRPGQTPVPIDDGGYFEFGGFKPWYFRVDGNQVSFSGTRVGSAANGTSPGNGYVDLAFPLNGDRSISNMQLVIETKSSF